MTTTATTTSTTRALDPFAHMRFLTIAQVTDLTTYTPQHIYRLERAGKFPSRVRLGANRVAWRLAEVEDWFAKRPTVRANAPQPANQ